MPFLDQTRKAMPRCPAASDTTFLAYFFVGALLLGSSIPAAVGEGFGEEFCPPGFENFKLLPTLRSEIGDIPWIPQSLGDHPKVIYGDDDRIDVFEETDLLRQREAASTCAILSNYSVIDNENGTFGLDLFQYTISGLSACISEPFGDQPTAPFCSGFLVGPDIVVTAGHCITDVPNVPGDPAELFQNATIVFGFDMLDANRPRTVFDKARVYSIVEVIGRALDDTTGLDYAVLRLDRKVTAPGAVPFEIRREDTATIETPLGVIGHPSGLPKKIAFGDTTQLKASCNEFFFHTNTDTYQGNSGSPVINAQFGIVEGILVRGQSDFVISSCFVSNQLSDEVTNSSQGEQCTKLPIIEHLIPQLTFHSGIVIFDKAFYVCNDTIDIRALDGDLDPTGSITVEISSTGGDSETVTLAGTAGPLAEFLGSIVMDTAAPTPTNGIFEAESGDTITVVYEDQSDHTGTPASFTATASIVCGASSGTIELDKNEYLCTDVAIITVADPDLDSSSIVSVIVEADSGDIEILTLDASAGAFTGSIQLDTGDAEVGNGTLEIADGDTITVTYEDEMGSSGAPASFEAAATVACDEIIVCAATAIRNGAPSRRPLGDLLVLALCAAALLVRPRRKIQERA